jgi:pathogenesis-related protein 1
MRVRRPVKGFILAAAGLLAAVAGALWAADDKAGTGSALSDDEAKALVAFHNEKRKEVKVPEVTWSKDVAAFAQEWADHVAETGEIMHRPRDGDFKQKYGENMAWGAGDFGVQDGAALWYGEKKAYDDGKQKLPDDLADIGHYTQMVWKTSLKIGAGKAVVKKGKLKGWTVIVCNYDPPGNYDGEKPY